MTGLDLARDALIEIACLITDGNLTVLDEGVDLVIEPPAEAVDGMLPVVRDMHTTSGLINELGAGVVLAEGPGAGAAVMCAATSRTPARSRCAATPSPPTAPSWPVTCPNSTRSCITGWWTCPASRTSSPGAGTRGPTSPARPSTAGTPGAGRHPGEHPGAALLPRGDLCPAAGSRLGHGAGNRQPLRRRPGWSRRPRRGRPGRRRGRAFRAADPAASPVSSSDFFPGAAMLHAAAGDGGCSSVG